MSSVYYDDHINEKQQIQENLIVKRWGKFDIINVCKHKKYALKMDKLSDF